WLASLEVQGETRHGELRADLTGIAETTTQAARVLSDSLDKLGASVERQLRHQSSDMQHSLEVAIENASKATRELSDSLTLVEARLEGELKTQCGSLRENLVEVGSLAGVATEAVRAMLGQDALTVEEGVIDLDTPQVDD